MSVQHYAKRRYKHVQSGLALWSKHELASIGLAFPCSGAVAALRPSRRVTLTRVAGSVVVEGGVDQRAALGDVEPAAEVGTEASGCPCRAGHHRRTTTVSCQYGWRASRLRRTIRVKLGGMSRVNLYPPDFEARPVDCEVFADQRRYHRNLQNMIGESGS